MHFYNKHALRYANPQEFDQSFQRGKDENLCLFNYNVLIQTKPKKGGKKKKVWEPPKFERKCK